MNIIDRAKAHFDAQGLTRIEVPEWLDESGTTTVMYSEPFTLADRKILSKYAQEDDLEFIVRMIIMKCETEEGKKAFDIADKPGLMSRADPNVISRIAAEIARTQSTEDMSGN